MREFFETHNAEALAQILERMLEAVRKGYWAADAETLKKMVETYAELAEAFDVETGNEQFKAFVDAQAAGFGLAPLATAQPADVPPAPQAAAAPTQQVHGQKLEEVAQLSENNASRVRLWLLLFGILLAGFISSLVERRPAAA